MNHRIDIDTMIFNIRCIRRDAISAICHSIFILHLIRTNNENGMIEVALIASSRTHYNLTSIRRLINGFFLG